MQHEGAIVAPPFLSIQSNLYETRYKNMPPLPTSVKSLEIPINLQTTTSGTQFILFQDNTIGILIAGSNSNLKILSRAPQVDIDGTFNVVAKLYQLFTRHVFIYQKQFPVVFAILANKQSDTYARCFRAIRDAVAKENLIWNPEIKLKLNNYSNNYSITY